MVEKAKNAGKATNHAIKTVYEVIVLAAMIAAAVKVATLPQVKVDSGNLPIWQVVAAVILSVVIVKIYAMQSQDSTYKAR